MKKTIFISLSVLFVIIIIFAVFAYQKNQKNNEAGAVAGVQNTATAVSSPLYFDDNATIMFFYSDYCSWCQKEKTVLEDLAKDGYRVKPMDVKAHPDYWDKYQITGTPAFIAKNGNKKIGYMDKDALKTWLDQNK
ncbi:MAG: thioredoxin family protein [Patescibacteria group bacterium]|nr:thioredoxin family protein [Patescibacteria group bacterium]